MAVALGGAVASADIFTLKDGKVWEGQVLGETDATIRVKTSIGGIVEIAKEQVEKREAMPPLKQVYRDRKKAIEPQTADAYWALGLWARSYRLSEEAREAFQIAVSLDPQHAGARQALGYERVDDKWLSPDERLRAKGLVEFRGRWMTEGERDRLLGAERDVQIEREILRYEQGGAADREAAKRALGDLVKPGSEASLLGRYGRGGAAGRILLVDLLAGLSTAEAGEGLLRISLEERDAGVRAAAIRALKAKNDPAALDRALLALERAPDLWARGRAAEVLGELGDLRAVPALVDALYVRRLYEEAAPVELEGIPMTRPIVIGKRVKVAKNVVAEEPVIADAWTVAGFREADAPGRLPSYEVVPEAREALRKLTGQDYGYRREQWRAWWETEGKKRVEAPTPPAR